MWHSTRHGITLNQFAMTKSKIEACDLKQVSHNGTLIVSRLNISVKKSMVEVNHLEMPDCKQEDR